MSSIESSVATPPLAYVQELQREGAALLLINFCTCSYSYSAYIRKKMFVSLAAVPAESRMNTSVYGNVKIHERCLELLRVFSFSFWSHFENLTNTDTLVKLRLISL